MSTNEVLLGLGLVLVLAVGSQVLARRVGLPAIVVLLPAGFLAGIATDDVNPDALLGPLYQPLIALAVGVILFEAGTRLSLPELASGTRRVIVRLVAVGILVTWLGIAATVILLFDGLDGGVALLVGAILVVSGPTVVLPLLAFIRPARRLRSLLKWEGVLVDPLGALLGVIVFLGLGSSSSGGVRWRPGELLASVGVGLLVGAAGAALLWLLLRDVQRNAPRLVVPVMLAVVVAAVVAADLIRDDSGLAAATLMGIAVGNQQLLDAARRIDISFALEFWETLVQLLVGVLFVLVAASVSPEDVRGVMPQALGLIAVMALIIRPIAVILATWRSRFTWRERAFVAWMAPRGIVAGATAAAFGPQLAQEGVAGADQVLPIVFVAIFGTVVLYGLTAPLVARMLGLAGTGRGLVLVVSGHPWARELAAVLKRSGLDVRMWVGPADDRAAARAAGLDADRGRMMVDAVNREAELEEATDALLLTPSDDFNAVAAADLRRQLGHGHVYRVAPDPEEPDLLPPSTEGGILGNRALTFAELSRLFAAGARIIDRGNDESPLRDDASTEIPLFAVAADGRLSVAQDGRPPDVQSGDRVIVLAHPSSLFSGSSAPC
jgi:NhaP-type Na+/H+ or K+/H+ antiporter